MKFEEFLYEEYDCFETFVGVNKLTNRDIARSVYEIQQEKIDKLEDELKRTKTRLGEDIKVPSLGLYRKKTKDELVKIAYEKGETICEERRTVKDLMYWLFKALLLVDEAESSNPDLPCPYSKYLVSIENNSDSYITDLVQTARYGTEEQIIEKLKQLS